jgi:hypothetical protein
MKRITLISAIIIGMMCSNTQKVQAQNNKGEFVASAGAGYSVLFAVLNSLGSYSSNITNGTITSNGIPVISVAGDYALSDRFSLGLGVGYQSTGFTVTGFSDSSNGLTNQSATVDISRLNIGLRPLFHFGSNPNIDPYLGFRVGVSIWNVGSSSTDPNFNYASKLTGALPSFQALFGLKGYFTPMIGAHIEVAIGTPYLVEAGLSFKFGGTVGGK